MSYNLLSEPVRRYIRDQGWEELRPIQNAAVLKILNSDGDYILASRTASGKTEAAFLPILSTVNFRDPGVQVIYISPLKALINDQFQRVEELCKYLDVTVTKWHGEANRTLKEKLIASPSGIVLITPESLEAMLANRPYILPVLFSKTRFIVIDEIHSFIGSDRGTHLRSILHRLRAATGSQFRLVGLSATIGDFEESKRFAGNLSNTTVLLDRTAKEIEAEFRFFPEENRELPLDLLKDMFREVWDERVLIFPNSRGRTEEIAVKLKKIAERVGGHKNYFSHHSSVDRDVREFIEFFAKSTRRENFTIACTSTLELGIDIGSVDKVVQVNTTNSVSSLVQRVGRSGRKEGKKGKLLLYATDRWSLLQALACWALFQENKIEPPTKITRPYDVLLHQVLSIVKGTSGIEVGALLEQLRANHAFSEIETEVIEHIVDHLISSGLLEKVERELIIGIEGEGLVNSREFYSIFETEHLLRVVSRGRAIGQMQLTPQVTEGENILLAARIWKIKEIDLTSMTIEVDRAADGKPPIFSGGERHTHGLIWGKMLELLYSDAALDHLDQSSLDELTILRKEFSIFPLRALDTERPFLEKENSTVIFTFQGTRTNAALRLFLRIADIDQTIESRSSSFELKGEQPITAIGPDMIPSSQQIDEFLTEHLLSNERLQAFTKWSQFLPIELQVKLLKERDYDVEGAAKFLSACKWVGADVVPSSA